MDVAAITGVFGARITGIDLAKPLASGPRDEISSALLRYKVLVFPDQRSVGPTELLAFLEQFGEPERTPIPTLETLPGIPEVKIIKNAGTGIVKISEGVNYIADDGWHTDGCTRGTGNTAWLSALQAVDIPDHGRDTLYADMEAAYDRLSPETKAFFGSLSAVHSYGIQDPSRPGVVHPLVMTNRKTGRKALYANRLYTRSIVGMRPSESRWVLEYIFEQAHIPENQLRVTWTPSTIVLWDNERTQHYVVHDHEYPRVMHRVMARQ